MGFPRFAWVRSRGMLMPGIIAGIAALMCRRTGTWTEVRSMAPRHRLLCAFEDERRERVTGKQREELVAALFGDATGEASLRCRAWMEREPRFAAFLEQFREKIRKKARYASGAEGLRDLLAELAVAYTLARERRFVVAYETYAAEKARGPDFTVTYKAHIPFNVEVKRLRPNSAALEPRLTDAICEKLRQMPPSTMNVLVVVTQQALEADAIATLLRELVARVERGDQALLARYGYAATRDFFAGFRRLSALVVRDEADGDGAALWRNGQARHPLHPDLPALLVH
jgi:hypothetical protein